MAKRKINLSECAGAIVKAFNPGILITTKNGDKVTTLPIMARSWPPM